MKRLIALWRRLVKAWRNEGNSATFTVPKYTTSVYITAVGGGGGGGSGHNIVRVSNNPDYFGPYQG